MKGVGPLLIVSGPSGSGKSTVIDRLLATSGLPLHLSVSATTRPPRDREKDGVHYFFWDRPHFDEEVKQGAFLEWAEVHGSCYGTLRREVEPYRQQGIGVILDIDVQGAAQVRQQCRDQVSVFLLGPSLATYEERLRKRGTESEAAIQRRLASAVKELARAHEYDSQVINDNLDAAVAQLKAILERLFERNQHAG